MKKSDARDVTIGAPIVSPVVDGQEDAPRLIVEDGGNNLCEKSAPDAVGYQLLDLREGALMTFGTTKGPMMFRIKKITEKDVVLRFQPNGVPRSISKGSKYDGSDPRKHEPKTKAEKVV